MARGTVRGSRSAAVAWVFVLFAAALSLRCGEGGRAAPTGDAAGPGSDSSVTDSGSAADATETGDAAGPGLDSSVADSGSGADATDALVSNDGPAVLRGSIQKGPFVLGSTLTLSTIDGSGISTGQIFTTQTTTDLGDFAVSFAYRGNVDIQAQGFYYNELTGALSTAPIVLRALYQVTNGGPQDAHVNIITHLAHDRAIKLMGDTGVGLAAAEAQAESELVTALGIGGAGFQPGGIGIQLNELGTNDDRNAYLFAVSAVLLQAARARAGDGGSLDATLQELANSIAAAIASGGQLSSSLTSELRMTEQNLDIDLVMDRFALRLQAIGSTAAVASLNRAVDTDGDGYRNSIDTCPLIANPDQSQVPNGVICKATRRTTFTPAASSTTTCAILGDFENTGRVGLLLCQGSANAELFSGDGTGRFSAPVPVQLPNAEFEMAFDVDQDGHLDVVSSSGWAPGDGAGHFGAVVAFPDALGPDGGALFYRGLALADLNGDTLPDLVRAAFTNVPRVSYGLAVSLGTGKGAFAPAVLSASLPNGWNAQDLVALMVGDVNADHRPDIAVVAAPSLGQSQLAALLGDGSGGFHAATPVPLLPAGVGIIDQAALADFDGDGNLDIGLWPNPVIVAFGDGTGGFSLTTTSTSGTGTAGLAADLNADGKADLALFLRDPTNSSAEGYLNVLLSQGRTFQPPQQLRTSPIVVGGNLTSGVIQIPSGDLNGDGVPDIVLVTADFNGTGTVQGIIMNYLQ